MPSPRADCALLALTCVLLRRSGAAALAGSTLGCAIHVAPPVNVRDPVTAYIADYGYHASLLLPRDESTLAEYAYGEWGWFALGKDQWYRALPAIAAPTQGTLARRDLEARTPEALRRGLGLEALHEIRVEREAARATLARLDRRFDAAADRKVYNPSVGMWFVPDPLPYSCLCQCNTAVAAWLDELGCRTCGLAVSAMFEVPAPERTEGGGSP